MLDAAEMALIQQDVAAAACDLPCQIQRSVTTSGAPGAPTVVTWPVVSAPGLLAGMKEPTAGQLTNYEYMIGDMATWHIQFPLVTIVNGQPVVTDVRELDRLVITEASGVPRTLSVVKLLQPRSYSALVSVLATE